MPKAVEYILQHFDQIPNMDELLQMSIIEVIKLDCKRDTVHRVCRLNLLATTVLTLTTTAAIHPSNI
jgi:coatomer subunit beta